MLLSSAGKVLGTHPSRAAAERQETAVQLSKLRKKGKKIPRKPSKKRKK